MNANLNILTQLSNILNVFYLLHPTLFNVSYHTRSTTGFGITLYAKKKKKNHQIFSISQKSYKFARNHKLDTSVCETIVVI